MATPPDMSDTVTTVVDTPRRRWDPVVRLTHWSVVVAVLANALFTEGGSQPHLWVGYALAAILALRLIWGLIGPTEARFTAFPPSPGRALRHVREVAAGHVADHSSHNPLGALMVSAIWATLSIIIASGIVMAGIPTVAGGTAEPSRATSLPSGLQAGEKREDDADEDEDEGRSTEGARSEDRKDHESDERGEGEKGEEGLFEEVHEVAVNLLYVLILLHLAGVVFETRRVGRHIVMAMLPGRR